MRVAWRHLHGWARQHAVIATKVPLCVTLWVRHSPAAKEPHSCVERWSWRRSRSRGIANQPAFRGRNETNCRRLYWTVRYLIPGFASISGYEHFSPVKLRIACNRNSQVQPAMEGIHERDLRDRRNRIALQSQFGDVDMRPRPGGARVSSGYEFEDGPGLRFALGALRPRCHDTIQPCVASRKKNGATILSEVVRGGEISFQ